MKGVWGMRPKTSRLLFGILCGALLSLVALASTPHTPLAEAQRRTCASFANQAAAQAAYRADPVGLANLDADHDGIACESNRCPCDRTPVTAATNPQSTSPAAASSAPAAPAPIIAPEGWVKVVRLIDGDTIDVQTPDGIARVRMYGTNTPELGESCSRDATAALDRLLTDNGRDYNVYLEYGPRRTDQNDRTLAYVLVADGDQTALLDWWMVWFGYAYAWREDGQHAAEIIGAEEDAQANGRGCLWAAPAPAPQPVSPAAPAPAPVSVAPPASPQPAAVPGRVAPISRNQCPASHPIKGNRSSMIYHVPGGASYNQTNPEDCFRTEADAQAAGYRRALR